MNKKLILHSLVLATILFSAINSHAQNPENWTASQLMEPADLAQTISQKKDVPVIISIGPGALVPNSIAIGPVNNKEGLEKFILQVKKLPKQTKIVVYCGCCPFEHCPNIRPAMEVLKGMKFTHAYLLNLPHNIKIDWIDKGYPVAQ